MNVKALKKKMIDCGVSAAEIANALQVDKDYVYKKLNGRVALTLGQANQIGELLGLTDEEYGNIFFCPENCVAQRNQPSKANEATANC